MRKFQFSCNCAPTLVISDVHGSTHWKDFLTQRQPDDRVIFLGDYFDRRGYGPFASSDAQNFLEICDYARNNPATYLLVGNHDYDYLPFARWQPEPWGKKERENREALLANLDLLQPLYVADNKVIFSHGGLSQTFMNENSLSHPAEVNQLWITRPEVFDFRQRDPATGQWSDRHGDDPWQSTIWARTKAMEEDGAKGYDQVAGHTPVRVPQAFATTYGDKILLTCTLDDTLIRVGF